MNIDNGFTPKPTGKSTKNGIRKDGRKDGRKELPMIIMTHKGLTHTLC